MAMFGVDESVSRGLLIHEGSSKWLGHLSRPTHVYHQLHLCAALLLTACVTGTRELLHDSIYIGTD